MSADGGPASTDDDQMSTGGRTFSQSGAMADSVTEPRTGSEPRPAIVLAVVAFGVFVAADDLTVVSTMLRPIIGDLGVKLPDGLDRTAWIVNAYLVAYVAVMPFAGRLSDLWGRRRVYIGALALFLIGSVWTPQVDTYGLFLAGRVMTAVGGGALVPIGLAVVGDVYPPGRRARALGILAAIDTLGWVWGPLYGAFLVRFLSWHWQFHLNVPLAIAGIAAAWWALGRHDQPRRSGVFDAAGAVALTVTLVALAAALLGSARIQTVSGLEELTGGGGFPARWLYLLAIAGAGAFWLSYRRASEPVIDLTLFRGTSLTAAVIVNFLTGGALVIAMVDVPLFVNVVEVDLARSAVISGWVLAALTASMAVMSYLGGRLAERYGYRAITLVGLACAVAGFLIMGIGWEPGTAYRSMAWQLALLGAGFGLVLAPTTAAVVDAAPEDRRGTAAGLVIVFRLMGLAVGLAGLTAWGLHRYNQLRSELVLPPIGSPGYEGAFREAQVTLTTSALADTFVAAAVVVVVALVAGLAVREHTAFDREPVER